MAARVVRLPDMLLTDPKKLWTQLFDMPVPTHIRGYFERCTAYRLLELVRGQPAVAGIPTVVPLQWGPRSSSSLDSAGSLRSR
ncbi:hypothetical protein CDC59_22370 (plasmid) [Ralstonia solanacearum]|nr:hypothetical protein CDC59_22370 [Ralstonia solanacearum]